MFFFKKNLSFRRFSLLYSLFRLLFIGGGIFCLFILLLAFGYERLRDFVPMLPTMYTCGLFFLLACLSYGLLAYWFWQHSKSFPIIFLITAVMLRLGWVLTSSTQPVSDFKVMYDYAHQAALGDYSFVQNDYFLRWPYQLNYTLYQSAVIRLFGAGALLPLKMINVILGTATGWIVYRLTSVLFGKSSGQVAGMMYATYVPNVIMTAVLTNQHLSIFFFTWGCYLLVKGKESPEGLKYEFKKVLGVGICFAIGTQFRPMGIFFAGLFVLFSFLREAVKKDAFLQRLKRFLLKTASFLLVYAMVQQLFFFSLVGGGILQTQAPGEPYWKFVVGLNANSFGFWNAQDATYLRQFKLGEQRNTAAKQLIRQRLQEPGKMAVLFIAKSAIMWGISDLSLQWNKEHFSIWKTQQDEAQIMAIERAQYLLFVALLAYFCYQKVKQMREKGGFVGERMVELSFPLWAIMAYVFVHFFIEVQDRYRLDIMPFFISLAAYGLVSSMKKIVTWRKK